LHYCSLDRLRDGICRITATDQGKSLDRSGLFGNQAAITEPSEAAA
jgi:hypothetical protein